MNENNQQHIPTTPTGSWGVITETDGGFNGRPARCQKAKAIQHIKATLAAFGPGEAISMAQDTWAKLHEAMSVLVEQTVPPAPVQEPDYKALYEKASQQYNELAALMDQSAPVQEPVSDAEIEAWAERHDIQGTPTDLRCMFEDAASFNTPPAAQRQWVGLNTIDRAELYAHSMDFQAGARWADAKLREKNGGAA